MLRCVWGVVTGLGWRVGGLEGVWVCHPMRDM